MENQSAKKKTEVYFNEIAKNYDNSHDGKFVKCMYAELLERVKQTPGKKILDLGCGNGNVLVSLQQYKDRELYGLDISEKMIQEAKRRLPDQVQLMVGDSEHLPYEDNSFDIIICNASFHHYTNPEKVMQEIRRVLRNGGNFILGDPTAPFEWYRKCMNMAFQWTNSGDCHIYGKKDITALLEKFGFEVSDWKKIECRAFLLNASLTA